MSNKVDAVIEPLFKMAASFFIVLIILILDLLCIYVWDYKGHLFTVINFIMGVCIWKTIRNGYLTAKGLRT